MDFAQPRGSRIGTNGNTEDTSPRLTVLKIRRDQNLWSASSEHPFEPYSNQSGASSRPDMDPSFVHHGGPAPRVSSSFSVGSLDGFFANLNHLPLLLSESVTLDSLSSKSSLETIPAAFPLCKSLPRCLLLGLGENLKFFSGSPSQDDSAKKPTRVVISSPTSPRLRRMLKESLSIQQWAESSAGWQAPGHIPWSDVTSKASTQPWTPEGSVLPADFLSVALLQARTRRTLSLKSGSTLSSSTFLEGSPCNTFDGRGVDSDGDIIDIMQELTEFQYYFETLPKEAELEARPNKVLSSPSLAVPSLVISNSHFSFPLPLESSQSISHTRPASLARRRGKAAPAPLLAPSMTMAEISYPDIPTAFLGSPSRESSVIDVPVSAPKGDLKSSLPFEEMIHNLRLQCATMEVRSPPADSTWNSRSAEPSPRKVPQKDASSCATRRDCDEVASTKVLPIDAEKPGLVRKPTKRLARSDQAEPRKKADKAALHPLAPQKSKNLSPTRKPPPVHTPADQSVEMRKSVPRGIARAQNTNPVDAVPLSVVKNRPSHPSLNSGARLVSLPQERLKSSKDQISRKASLTSRKPHLPSSKVKIPSASSILVSGIAAPDSLSSSSDCSSSVPDAVSHGNIKSPTFGTKLQPINNATNRGPDHVLPSVAPGLPSAFLKKGLEKKTNSTPIKTVRFALPHDEVEEDDNLWSGPLGLAVDIRRPAAPFTKTLADEDALSKHPKSTAASSRPSASQETPSLLHRSGSLVRKASWKILPSTRMMPLPKTRPHSVAIASPLRQSITIPDPPDMNALDADDDEHAPLIGTRRTTHSLGRHSLSRIMSLRHPMFSGGGKENKRATIAFSGSTSVEVDENVMRRQSQAAGSIDMSPQKSRMPVPLRNILTRFK